MGLFGFGNKTKAVKNPQTFEEWADVMLLEKDRARAVEASHTLWRSCLLLEKEQKLPMMAWLANRTVELARSDMNRAMAMEVFGQVLRTEQGNSADHGFYNVLHTHPEEVRMVEAALKNLYENGGEAVRAGFRNAAGAREHGDNIPVINIDGSFIRPELKIIFKDEAILRNFIYQAGCDRIQNGYYQFPISVFVQSDNFLFPVFDYIVDHQDDMSAETQEKIRAYLQKAITKDDLRISHFRDVYLPSVGRKNAADLAEWYEKTFCS